MQMVKHIINNSYCTRKMYFLIFNDADSTFSESCPILSLRHLIYDDFRKNYVIFWYILFQKLSHFRKYQLTHYYYLPVFIFENKTNEGPLFPAPRHTENAIQWFSSILHFRTTELYMLRIAFNCLSIFKNKTIEHQIFQASRRKANTRGLFNIKFVYNCVIGYVIFMKRLSFYSSYLQYLTQRFLLGHIDIRVEFLSHSSLQVVHASLITGRNDASSPIQGFNNAHRRRILGWRCRKMRTAVCFCPRFLLKRV